MLVATSEAANKAQVTSWAIPTHFLSVSKQPGGSMPGDSPSLQKHWGEKSQAENESP